MKLARLIPNTHPAQILSEARIKQEVRGSHSGQLDLTLKYYDKDTLAGYLDYTEYKTEVSVQMIEVAAPYKRKGIATKLLRYLDKLYPDTEIDYGMQTGEGAALIKAYQRKYPKKIDFERGFKNKDFVLSFIPELGGKNEVAHYQLEMAFAETGIDLSDYDLSWEPDMHDFQKAIQKVRDKQWAAAAKELRERKGIHFNSEIR